MTVTIYKPYDSDLLFGPGVGINIMGYNTVFESTECVKTTVTDTVLGSTVRIKNTVIV